MSELKADLKNMEGQVVGKLGLPSNIFGCELNDHVLHSVVKNLRANRRQGTHATKTRSFVSGGGKKPFRQKGTGSARQGTSRSPLMPGGAVCHGPQPRDYRAKSNKRLKQKALAVALSDRMKNEGLTVVDQLGLSAYSTKALKKILDNLKVTSSLILDVRKDDFLFKSARNLPGVASICASMVTAEDVLRFTHVIATKNGIEVLTKRLEDNK